MIEGALTLQEVADELGVHYMTAYRYVRLGILDATKSGGVWQVQRSTLEQFREAGQPAAGATPAAAGSRRAPWSARLESRLVAGDASGAWSVIEAAMAAGADLDEVYLEILTPAMASIGERWAAGELDIAIEHLATGIAMRIVGRIGPRFSRRGRARGVVAIGAPAGAFHALPVAMLGDLLRLRGWEVSDFGVDVPSESIAHVVRQMPDLLAVGLSAMASDNLASLADACTAVRSVDPEVFLIVGGHAVTDDAHARELGADAYAAGGEQMHELLTARAAG
jgi:excisionase family DNA binding protein